MAGKIVWAAEVTKLPEAVASVEAAEAKMGKSAGLAQDEFKKITRDIGTMGGKSAETFTHMGDDILSTIELLGSGGLTGGVALLSLAIGGLSYAYEHLTEKSKAAQKAQTDAIKEVDEQRKLAVENTMANEERLDEKGLHRLELAEKFAKEQLIIESNALRSASARVRETQAALDNMKVWERTSFVRDQLNKRNADALAAEAIALSKVSTLTTDIATAERARQAGVKKKFTDDIDAAREEQEKKNKAAAEAEIARQKAIRDARKKRHEDQEEQSKKEYADAASANDAFEGTAADKAAIQADFAALDKRDADEKKAREEEEADRYKQIADERHSQKEIQEDDSRKAEAQGVKNATATRAEEAAMRALSKATVEQMGVTFALNAATDAYGVAVMGLQPIMDIYQEHLTTILTLNRDDWATMKERLANMPAMLAAEIQAKLANIAAEASAKSVLSAAEAEFEFGIGTALLFTPGGQGAGLGHIAAGAQLSAASAMYGILGGGAAVGAGLLGASIGQGGLFKNLKKEDAEKKTTQVGGGSGGGRSSGASGGSGDGGGGTTINITYGAGAIAPADQRATERTVTTAVRRGNADWFNRTSP